MSMYIMLSNDFGFIIYAWYPPAIKIDLDSATSRGWEDSFSFIQYLAGSLVKPKKKMPEVIYH